MIEIGLRATKIRNPDNLVVVVPNNEIMQRDIIDYTMSGEHIRLRIPFSCASDSDIEKAELLLSACLTCAVERRCVLAGANPARQLLLQPVAIGAVRGGNDTD